MLPSPKSLWWLSGFFLSPCINTFGPLTLEMLPLGLLPSHSRVTSVSVSEGVTSEDGFVSGLSVQALWEVVSDSSSWDARKGGCPRSRHPPAPPSPSGEHTSLHGLVPRYNRNLEDNGDELPPAVHNGGKSICWGSLLCPEIKQVVPHSLDMDSGLISWLHLKNLKYSIQH